MSTCTNLLKEVFAQEFLHRYLVNEGKIVQTLGHAIQCTRDSVRLRYRESLNAILLVGLCTMCLRLAGGLMLSMLPVT